LLDEVVEIVEGVGEGGLACRGRSEGDKEGFELGRFGFGDGLFEVIGLGAKSVEFLALPHNPPNPAATLAAPFEATSTPPAKYSPTSFGGSFPPLFSPPSFSRAAC